jgi:YHS domain-containing protein
MKKRYRCIDCLRTDVQLYTIHHRGKAYYFCRACFKNQTGFDPEVESE